MVCDCGFTNKQGARFCGSCGKPLANAPGIGVSTDTIAQPPRPRAARFSKGSLSLLLAIVVIGGFGYWWSTRPPGRYVADNSDLFPISEGNKYGFMNKSGQTAIPPQFDEVKGFSEGMSAVRVGNKWGYINTAGQITITPQFDDAQSFYYGHAAVKLCCGPWFSNDRNDRYGFIDTDGKYIHTPEFRWVGVSGFERQVAPVTTAQGQISFLNRQGQLLYVGKFESATNAGFTEGLAAVRSGGKWGFVDERGEWAINPQFESAQEFSEGLAAVTVGGKTGFIDRSGRFAINPQFASASVFVEGHAIFGNEKGEYGLINREGQVTIEAGKYQSVDVLKNGLMRVKTAEGWGFVDSTGAIVVPPEFDSAGSFQNGLARVTALGKEGYITTSGSFVINPFPGSSLRQERARLAEEAKKIAADAFPGTTVRAEKARLVAEAAQAAANAATASRLRAEQGLLGEWVQDSYRLTITSNGGVIGAVMLTPNGREVYKAEILDTNRFKTCDVVGSCTPSDVDTAYLDLSADGGSLIFYGGRGGRLRMTKSDP